MRLVAWNVNDNNRKRKFSDTLQMIEPLAADILILSETAPPDSGESGAVAVVGGGRPCLAVVARNGFRLQPRGANAAAPPLTAAFLVQGRVDFNLIAAWPIQSPGGDAYHQLLMRTLDSFGEFASSFPTLFAGDLNTSSRVLSQKDSHPQFAERMRALGLESAYHFQSGEAFGEETAPSYLHGSKVTAPFHIDYCFVSKPLAPAANASLLRGGEWAERSDHFPLVVDIPDEAFRRASSR